MDYIKIKYPKSFNPEMYKDKTIIVVGGGPTTNLVNWQNLDYDIVFSCNQFYENEKLEQEQVNVVSLINRVFKMNSDSKTKLETKLDTDNTFIAIEPYHSHSVFNLNYYKSFVKKYSDRCLFFDTTFQNRAGAAPRLAILATFFKPKRIYMVGIDGHGSSTTKHSFDKSLVGIRDKKPLHVVNKDYINFAKYIGGLCNKLNIELYNLGEGYIDNMASSISKINYPLSEEIKNAIQ